MGVPLGHVCHRSVWAHFQGELCVFPSIEVDVQGANKDLGGWGGIYVMDWDAEGQ